MDSGTKALEEMSRAQSDHRRKYGEPDPGLQRRIDALMKRKGLAKKKKDPEAPYTDNPTPGKPGWNLAKAKRKKAYKKSKKA